MTVFPPPMILLLFPPPMIGRLPFPGRFPPPIIGRSPGRTLPGSVVGRSPIPGRSPPPGRTLPGSVVGRSTIPGRSPPPGRTLPGNVAGRSPMFGRLPAPGKLPGRVVGLLPPAIFPRLGRLAFPPPMLGRSIAGSVVGPEGLPMPGRAEMLPVPGTEGRLLILGRLVPGRWAIPGVGLATDAGRFATFRTGLGRRTERGPLGRSGLGDRRTTRRRVGDGRSRCGCGTRPGNVRP